MRSGVIVSAMFTFLIWSFPSNAIGKSESPPLLLELLSDAELDTFHGGFVTPSGLQMHIGVSGFAEASALNGPLNEMSSLIQYRSNAGELILQNAISSTSIQASTQLNVDVANYSQLHLQLATPVQNMIGGAAGFPLPH